VRQGVHRAAAVPAVALAVALTGTGCGPVLEELDPGPPSAEVLALAEEMAPTDAGREAFLESRPQLVAQEAVDRACLGARGEGWWGCYTNYFDTPRILLYDLPDDRLHGYLVGSATWALLGAAYDSLGDLARAEVDGLVQAEVDALPPDHPVREDVDRATDGDLRSVGWQGFAVLGSSIPTALAPALEARYAEFLTDRVATVGIEQANVDALDALSADLAARWDAQAATEQANVEARSALEADASSLELTRTSYNASVEEYNASSPDQRSRSTARWTLWDGTVVESQPMGDALTAVREHLEWAAADQRARREPLDAADVAAAASREELDAVAADLDELWALLGPSQDED